MSIPGPSSPRLSLLQLFWRFLRFGLFAFGGPVAQIAMVKQVLVEEDRWISPERFNRLLAVVQILLGPEAHELCVHLGMVARGRVGLGGCSTPDAIPPCRLSHPGLYAPYFLTWLASWDVGAAGRGGCFRMVFRSSDLGN